MPAYKNAIVVANSTDGIAGNPARRQIFKMALALPALHWLGASSFAAERAGSFAAVPGSAYSPGGVPLFFTDAEREFIDGGTARIIPDGEDGLGARSAAVGYFIDRQLAGPYGHAVTWYMQGPWKDGTKQQGYQSEQTPAELYRAAIRRIDTHCRQQYSDKVFAALSGADQDRVLQGLEKGEIKFDDVDAKQFFDLLLQNTTEGFLADPMYGGNRNFAGWRLIGFPGPRYNYMEEITQYGKRYTLPPVGLLGRNGFLVQGV